MTPPSGYSEDELIEQPAIALCKELGWETINCFREFDDGPSPLGRETKADVIIVSRLRPALMRLNRDAPKAVIDAAIEVLNRDRSAMSQVQANREVYDLLKGGVKVRLGEEDEDDFTVQVIDWKASSNNDFLLASQFWITGELYTRRTDLLGFVNGIPLVFIELKASHKRLENAYKQNLADYKDTIPKLFWFNGLVILSNGGESRIGSMTAQWEHFAEWKRINDEGEKGVVSLETMLRGTCDPARLLDLVENFVLFDASRGSVVKILAKNHQYLGVNNALDAIRGIKKNKGRLGVFWHTQGSGKSVSMIFLSQKVLRKVPGNWTFVIVTDRDELDEQIHKNFVAAGVVGEKGCHAGSSKDLRRLLREDHRYVFTLIHKFRTDKGEKHPVLSERDDVVVIADEAHRTQYDTLALNMRTALPNAAFIAFTGTPLIAAEEKTRQVFGDYVSIYNFAHSIEDRSTVPLFYDNRIPELQVTNQNLNEDMYGVIEDAELDEGQEKKLEREFAREYHLITRDDRLERIAEDIVAHFIGRGFRGKAMVVSIDKATAVRMYDKVRKHWAQYRTRLAKSLSTAPTDQRPEIEFKLNFMDQTDMAVVVSQAQGEVEEMRRKGLDIAGHRRRIVNEDLEEKFKNPSDPFRIAFVCAMWMTGFDVPSCSTIYLDKPMRGHTLMQTIARANRVFGEKQNGLIVDYVGVFRNLQKALAIYGTGSGGRLRAGDLPLQAKAELVRQLNDAIGETERCCAEAGVELTPIVNASGFDRVRLMDDAVDALVASEETKRQYATLAGKTVRLFRSVLPDPTANELAPRVALIDVLADKIKSLSAAPDISGVLGRVEDVLDRSVAAEGYVIHAPPGEHGRLIDLSTLDVAALKKAFEKGHKHIEVERLSSVVQQRARRLVQLNHLRADYLAKLQRMIEEYNQGAVNVQVQFDRLVQFARDLSAEDQRAMTERLTEEELAVFDLLTKPEMKLTVTQRNQVKTVAHDLLSTLKQQKIVLDWRKRQQARAAVRLTIEQALDGLPPRYTKELYEKKCELVFQHVFDAYEGPGKSVYAQSA